MLRELTPLEVAKLAKRKGVKTDAVMNFLISMGKDSGAAWGSLRMDARSYKWNSPTQNAISDGIKLASTPCPK